MFLKWIPFWLVKVFLQTGCEHGALCHLLQDALPDLRKPEAQLPVPIMPDTHAAARGRNGAAGRAVHYSKVLEPNSFVYFIEKTCLLKTKLKWHHSFVSDVLKRLLRMTYMDEFWVCVDRGFQLFPWFLPNSCVSNNLEVPLQSYFDQIWLC